MKIVFLYSDRKAREVVLADAFVAGLKRHSIDAEKFALTAKHSVPLDTDVACMFGVKSRDLWWRYRRAGAHVIYFDKGYVRTGSYWRVAVDAHHPTARLMDNQPDDRLRALRLRPAPWRTSGEHIVIAGSSAKYHAFHGLVEPTAFTQKLVKRVGKRTSRQIVYRPKPSWSDAAPIEGSTFSSGGTITGVLRGAHALVTHGSNACFEAMLAGVPSVVLGDAVARPISSTDVAEIENPRIATDDERWRLLSNLAYFQWTLAEMASGEAWDFLKGHIRQKAASPLYDEMCSLLGRGHGQGDDLPEATLNRLFRKTCDEVDAPWLSPSNVTVSLERRTLKGLVALASQADGPPMTFKHPVTLVNYRGRCYMIDGSKRVRGWAASGREAAPAFIVTVR